MDEIRIIGGRRLYGTLSVQGSKNSVLPILAATVLHKGCSRLCGCPRISDVEASIRILEHLGCRVWWEQCDLLVDAACLTRWDIPQSLMREMRSSVIFLGAILGRLGRAEMSYPGGCQLGPRPIDAHLSMLRQLGATVDEDDGLLRCQGEHLIATELSLPMPSVGATENAMLAACGAEGETVICNAAREPEIVDLQAFLQSIGCRVRGAGTSTICVEGRQPTHDGTHKILPDRIVASTYLAAVAATGGEVELTNVVPSHFAPVITALYEAGCTVVWEQDRIILKRETPLRGIKTVRTSPYPGFPTDAQAILMATMLKARGATVFVENMFENRYRHVEALRCMGADIHVTGRVAVVSGVEMLSGVTMQATDLRGGAALLIAALSAEGESRIGKIRYIHRGYQQPVEDLRLLGADIGYYEGEKGANGCPKNEKRSAESGE